MSGNLTGFDANTVQPNNFELLPAGEYQACIVASAVEPTKKGDGRFLAMELQVLDGQHQGRKLFDRLNLWNPSPKAVQIAQATLSAICRATGVLTPNDSAELHNRPLLVKVVVTKSDEYGDKNEIKAYHPVNGAARPSVGQLPPRGTAAPNDEIPF